MGDELEFVTLDTLIGHLELSERATRSLYHEGVKSVGDLLRFPTLKIGDIRNVGEKTKKEIFTLVRRLARRISERHMEIFEASRRLIADARDMADELTRSADEMKNFGSVSGPVVAQNRKTSMMLVRLAALVEAHVIDGPASSAAVRLEPK